MKRILSVFLCAALMLSCATVLAHGEYTCNEMSEKLKGWLSKEITVSQAQGEVDAYLDWTVFSMARSGDTSFNKEYSEYIGSAVSKKNNLTLTDCARIAMTVSAVGLDATNVGGVNLIEKIRSTDITKETYTTSISYALTAMNYYNGGEDTDKLLSALLSAQRTDGGFNAYLVADENSYWTVDGEVDATGMVLQSLAPFKGDTKVAAAIEKALGFIKKNMMDDAGYGSWGSGSAESTAQVLAALCELGIDPLSDEYTKAGKTIFTALSAYINTDGGARSYDGSSNLMTSYQVLFALDAYEWYNSKYGFSIFDCTCLNPYCKCISHGKYAKLFILGSDEILCKVIQLFSKLFGFEYICCKH